MLRGVTSYKSEDLKKKLLATETRSKPMSFVLLTAQSDERNFHFRHPS